MNPNEAKELTLIEQRTLEKMHRMGRYPIKEGFKNENERVSGHWFNNNYYSLNAIR